LRQRRERFQRVYDLEVPQWNLLTIYELECDDPETMVNGLRDASGSAVMTPLREEASQAQ
jgi:hypothetical protein